MNTKSHLGRIGALAENLRVAARNVTSEMLLSPGEDALIEALNELEDFQAGWV